MRTRRYTEEEILKLLKAFYLEHGRTPKTATELGPSKGFGLPSHPTIRKFGGIKELYKKLNVFIDISKDMVDSSILEFYSIYNRAPFQKELGKIGGFNLYSQTVYNKFGGLTKICLDIGIIPNRFNLTNKEDISKIIYKYCINNDLKYLMNINELDTIQELPSANLIRKLFGDANSFEIYMLDKYNYMFYRERGIFSTPVKSSYGFFTSKIEYAVFLELLTYFSVDNIERQRKYNDIFNTNTKHTADFYIPIFDIIIEVTTKNNGIPGYEKTKQWKLNLSDNVYFVYNIQELQNIMKKLGVNKLMDKYRNSKSYYDINGVSCEKIIYSCNMLFEQGSAFKYIFRNNYQNPKDVSAKESDMKKVLHYLEQCRKNSDYPRINNSKKHISSLDEPSWPPRLYKAMVLILLATASRDANPYQMYTEAIEVVSEELLCC